MMQQNKIINIKKNYTCYYLIINLTSGKGDIKEKERVILP